MPRCKRAFAGHQDDGDGDEWRAQKKNDAGSVDRPDEQRQPPPGHAGSAQTVNGYDEIQAGKDGGKSDNEDGEPGFNDLVLVKDVLKGV